jgi:hypothetical protein
MPRSPLRSTPPRRAVAALVLAAALAACGDRGDSRAVGERARATAAAAPPAPAAAPTPLPGDSVAGEVATVRGLSGGDRACYVELEVDGLRRPPQEAAFDLCSRAELVGQRVRLERRRAWVLAASCQGDPECERRDTVDLIVSAEPLPRDTPAAAHR